jgi:VWFA-related protein
MAVVHTGGATDASQEFTSSKRLLLAAVDRAFGRKVQSATLARSADALSRTGTGLREPVEPVADPVEAERYYQARQSLTALKSVADWFTTVRGRRKAILFVSEGIDYDIGDFENRRASLIMDATREALAAAARGNVSIYGIDPRGLTTLGDQTIELGSLPAAAADTSLRPGDRSMLSELQLSQASLRQLSDDTGGFAVINTNNLPDAFDRIVRDNSTYYAMAYYPPTGTAGAFHRIEVRVRRPELRVRARRGYVTPNRAAPRAEGSQTFEDRPGVAGAIVPEARAALDSPLPVSGLAMKVFAIPFKGAAPNASVLVGVEIRGRDLQLDAQDKVAVTYMAIDATGRVRGGRTDSLTMELQPGTRARVATSGLRLLGRVDLPPGRYQLRFAAHDSGSGDVGSVHYDLDVPDFEKLPFSMSGLALTSAASLTAPTVRPDEPLRQVLPGPPVAARAFPQNDEVAVFAEVYDNEASKPHRVDITTTVTTDEGRVLITTEHERDSSELRGLRGGYGYSTRFSLKELAPGPYVLTVAARSRLANMPVVQRQVQFTVTEPRAVPLR